MGIQANTFAEGCWWLGCYGKPKILLKTDASFNVLGKYEFDCSYGISRSSDKKLLVGRSLGKKGYRGQVFPAQPDETQGLRIIQKPAHKNEK